MPKNTVLTEEWQLPRYTASGIGAIYTLLPKGLTPFQRKAAARALLRHDVYIDGTHSLLKRDGGLHPSFTALHNIGDGFASAERGEVADLVDETLKDTLNALTMMDRIDGGITLLLRCPGYRAWEGISLEDITLDVYFSPRELTEGGQKLRSAIDTLMQIFGEDVVSPHLKRFTARCGAEGIRNIPVQPPYGLPLSNGDFKFPDAFPKGSSRFRCRCQSSRIRMGENSPTFATLPNTSVPQPDGPARGLTHAIISIGSNSDAVIDRFGLGDGVILQLHTLMTTVRSSKWEEKLRTAEWGLSFEQAVSLSNGLLLDLEVIKLKAQPVRSRNFSRVLLLGVAFLLVIVAYYIGRQEY